MLLKKLLSPKIKRIILSIFFFPERIIFFIIKKVAKQYPYFCLNLLPNKLKDKFKKDIKFRYRMNKFIKLLINESEANIFNNLSDKEKSESVQQEWTIGRGLYWYEREEKKYSINDINKKRIEFINFLDIFLKIYPVQLLCEIGTGDGRFLNYLVNKYPKVKYFVGIDLINELMEKNKQKYPSNKNSQINFLSGQISEKFEEIINTNNTENILFLATRTFTCFTQSELETLFSKISNSKKAIAVGFFEQNDIDLKKEKLSRARSQKNRFSHNYINLLEKYNFKIVKKEILYNSKILNDYGIIIFATNKNFKY